MKRKGKKSKKKKGSKKRKRSKKKRGSKKTKRPRRNRKQPKKPNEVKEINCDEPFMDLFFNYVAKEDSTLKKKSQSIAYHFVREGVARGEWRTTYINTHLNEADLLTKPLPNGAKRKQFVMNMLHHILGVGCD